jgi:hypothetical protein
MVGNVAVRRRKPRIACPVAGVAEHLRHGGRDRGRRNLVLVQLHAETLLTSQPIRCSVRDPAGARTRGVHGIVPLGSAPVIGQNDHGLKSFSANPESFRAKQPLTSRAAVGKHGPLTSQSRRPTLRPAVLTAGSPFRTSVSDNVADVFKE